VLARSEGEFDAKRAAKVLNGEPVRELDPKAPVGEDLSPHVS
jgi:hypothetical protein